MYVCVCVCVRATQITNNKINNLNFVVDFYLFFNQIYSYIKLNMQFLNKLIENEKQSKLLESI